MLPKAVTDTYRQKQAFAEFVALQAERAHVSFATQRRESWLRRVWDWLLRLVARAPIPGDAKPQGRWRCRACLEEWDGQELYLDPAHTSTTWICGNLFCGGTCDPIKEATDDH